MSLASGVGVLEPDDVGDEGVVADHQELGNAGRSDPGKPRSQDDLQNEQTR